LDLTPLQHCIWQHRFDDPLRTYRTLYCAQQRKTSFLEVLEFLRPKLSAVRELAEKLGVPLEAAERDTGKVTLSWIVSHALAPGFLQIVLGQILDLDDPALRRKIGMERAELFLEHGVEKLDISTVRSPNRKVTQPISRFLYDLGAAGIQFGSNVDGKLCLALFEDRARLDPGGPPEPLAGLLHEIDPILEDLGLTLSWQL